MTPSYEDAPDIPTLTRRAGDAPSVAPPSPSPLSNAVLQTLLQVEIERAVRRAIDDAVDGVRLRLEQEIPAIVDRTLRRINTSE